MNAYTPPTPVQLRPPQSAASWWPFVLVVAAYGVVALQQITLPGVYMDAVNPDYLVVGVLNPHAESIGAWLLDGNYVLMKWPVLISFYHGSQQFWLGLPLFWIFGTTVTGLRLAHAMFALGLLGALYAMLARGGLKPWQSALACGALAIDPAFSYAFRTQSYITLAPAAWLFLSVYCMFRAAQSPQRWRWALGSGALYGLAVVGYFIYAFFLPAMALALHWSLSGATREPGTPPARHAWLAWCAGGILGGIFYIVGYGLTIQFFGGLHEAWDYFQKTQRALNAFTEQVSLGGRLAYLATMLESVVQNWFHHELIFAEHETVPGASFKTALLLGGPLALWVGAEWRRQSSVLLRVLVALAVSFCVFALVFGTRLSGHHFMVLLPLAYGALAAGLRATVDAPPAWRSAVLTYALPLAVLAALNIGGQVHEAKRLHETQGVGLYSDAINRLAEDLDERGAKVFAYFPDWGLSMPVAFLTGGRVGMDSLEDYAGARRKLCAGRDIALAVITGERRARIEAWRQQLRWDAPTIQVYRQGDGKVVFEVATFSGRPGAPGCAGS
ncbi:MAG: hypothetical protein ABI624_17145 [Casimicrobiaceae bacterium]